MKHLKLFIFILFFTVAQLGVGQKRVWEKFGDESMALNDAFAASQFYKKALAEDSTDLELSYKYMQALAGYQNFEVALFVANQIRTKIVPEEFPDFTYDLANIHKHLAQYDSAYVLFKTYISGGPSNSKLNQRAKQEVDEFPKLRELLNDTVAVDLYALPGEVNTGASEFATVFLSDTALLFSSLRSNSILEEGKVVRDDDRAGIYRAHLIDSLWEVGEKLLSRNSSLSMANGAFNSDRTKFFFTQCELYSNCKIYQGSIVGDSILNVEVLPPSINVDGGNTTHPFFVEIEGKTLLFYASNQIGGLGGMDLYVSEYRNGWKSGKNLGKTINTVGNELSPFYSIEDSTLYFASDGHYNLGGFDLFESKGTAPKTWSEVVNLGLPINSRLNDLYYTPKGSQNAWLTSSRSGSITEKDAPCCNDVYELHYPAPLEPKDTVSPLFLKLVSQQPVVYFHNDRPNEDSWDTLTAFTYKETYRLYEPRQEEYRKGFSGQYKAMEEQVAKSKVDTFFNDYLRKGWKDLLQFSDELIAALDSGISVQVDLHGFASPLTKSDYNVNLSKRRISSIQNFLVSYRDSVMKPYLLGTATNGASLTYEQTPNGEYKAKPEVSDDYYDVSNSIYNPAAALERKVELKAKLLQWQSIPIWSLNETKKILTVAKEEERVLVYLLNEGEDSVSFTINNDGSNRIIDEENEIHLVKGQVHLLELEVGKLQEVKVFSFQVDEIDFELTISIQ